MGKLAQQAALYIGLFLICCTYTLIAPFYPKIAREKGIPLWLIGVVFSLNPIGNIMVGLLLGKYLIKLGRKNVIMASYFLTAASLLILSPIELFDKVIVIILSFVSRILAGMGTSCVFVTITTIFISDYPDKVQIMIGRMEACIGIGLILGPILGFGLYSLSLYIAMPALAGVILLFSPVAFKMIGQLREYNFSETDINRFELFLKPRVFLSVLMNVSFLFSFGLLASMLQVHLSSFGLSTLYVTLCFMMQSSVYFTLSLTGGYFFKSFDQRWIMFAGQLIFVIAYLLLAPWDLIFPDDVWIVILALPVFSFAQNMVYMYSIPYMIHTAVKDYGYAEDDILTDAIAGFSSFGCAFGEIIGPLYAGLVTDFVGMQMTCLIASIMSLAFAVVFVLGTGLFSDRCKKKERLVYSEEEVFGGDSSMQVKS